MSNSASVQHFSLFDWVLDPHKDPERLATSLEKWRFFRRNPNHERYAGECSFCMCVEIDDSLALLYESSRCSRVCVRIVRKQQSWSIVSWAFTRTDLTLGRVGFPCSTQNATHLFAFICYCRFLIQKHQHPPFMKSRAMSIRWKTSSSTIF